jgi:2-(1,2-epoxy-1,2-dihydrophenyl)acetyl-CoA isomerase
MNTGNFRGFETALEVPGILVITFNQPEKLNGMTSPMKRDLIEILAQAQMSDAVRIVLFAGTGRAFSAGDDITANQDPNRGAEGVVPDIPMGWGASKNHALGIYNGLRLLSQSLNVAVRHLDKLTIAAMNGYSIQAGMSLALACDFRIAATDAKIGSGTLRFGYLPDEGGQYLLVQHMGIGKTMDFLMRNRIVSGQEALELGLVHEVVAPETLMETAMDLARELANGPQVAMRLLKQSVYNAAEMAFPQALDDIASKTAVSDQQPDAEEGVMAWREKRTPKFNRWLE